VAEHSSGGRFDVTIAARYDDILDATVDVLARRGFHHASIRQIARAANLSLAGLYHYVRGKDELVFLALARALDDLVAALDEALVDAHTPADRLLALARTHLEFAFTRAADMKIVNRDYELLPEPRRSEIVARRGAYLDRCRAILAALDRRERSRETLGSATVLLLGMLNGIATRPFLRTANEVAALATEVTALFLHGFLEPTPGRTP
jgi:AcrR family transcriptional regulator